MKEVKVKPKYKVGQIIEHNQTGSQKFARITRATANITWDKDEATIVISYILQNLRSVTEACIVRVVAEK